jgi:hypothetical protein
MEEMHLDVTESMASSFIPVDRMNLRSSGLTGWTYFPQPRIRISGRKYNIFDVINTSTLVWFTNLKNKTSLVHPLALTKCQY